MTSQIKIGYSELLDYGEKQKLGQLHILRMTTLKHGYELTISDDKNYQTFERVAECKDATNRMTASRVQASPLNAPCGVSVRGNEVRSPDSLQLHSGSNPDALNSTSQVTCPECGVEYPSNESCKICSGISRLMETCRARRREYHLTKSAQRSEATR